LLTLDFGIDKLRVTWVDGVFQLRTYRENAGNVGRQKQRGQFYHSTAIQFASLVIRSAIRLERTLTAPRPNPTVPHVPDARLNTEAVPACASTRADT
jgi:hypothetical protein